MVDHLLLGTVEPAHILVSPLKRLVDAGIFYGQGHQVGHGSQKVHVAAVKGAFSLVHRTQDADHSLLYSEGNVQHVFRMELSLFVHLVVKIRTLGRIGNDQGLSGPVYVPGHPLVHGKPDLLHLAAGLAVLISRYRDVELLFLLIDEDDHGPGNPDQFLDLAGDILQHAIQPGKTVQGLGDAKQGPG